MNRQTLSTLTLMAVACWTIAVAQTPPVDTNGSAQAIMPKHYAAIFKQYCFECHDSDTQEGKLDLEQLSFEISKDISTAEHWDNILAALNSKEMPPEDATQIPNDQKSALLADLSQQMVLARNILGDGGGEITMRRLNRREYQNTLEALLGFRPEVSTLPDDDATGGFDTSGGSLFFSSDQFEQYRATATGALEYAFNAKPRPMPRTVRLEGETISAAYIEKAAEKKDAYTRAKLFLAQNQKPATEFGFTTPEQAKNVYDNHHYSLQVYDLYFFNRPESKTGTILLPGRHNGPVKRMPRVQVKAWYPGGTYKVRIKAASYGDSADHERYLQVNFLAGKNSHSNLDGLAKVSGSIKNPQLIELQLTNPVGIKGAFKVKQRNYEEPWPYKIDMIWKAKNGVGRLPAVWVDYVEVDGPYFDDRLEQLPTMLKASQNQSNQSDEQYARTAITRFATRAFRNKTPNPQYIDKLVRYYLNRRTTGDDSRKAMIDSLALVLSSPSFVYLTEPAATPKTIANAARHQANPNAVGSRTLSLRELAIRLSYFLWSSPPDKALMSSVNDGSLANPEVLKAQTERLLRDTRFDRCVSGFAHQWLDMKRIDMFDFSPLDYPQFDESVRKSARHEVYQTIRHVADANLPIDTLLKSDFVIVNDVLADFYGLNDLSVGTSGSASSSHAKTHNDSAFRKVSLPAGSKRGGLLGTAAVHIMGSDGLRSSPVERGAWVLRHLLNDPPPPAPPNVPMLEHADAVLSIRDLQKRHQEEPQCASCHRKIDPIGYGLENFNAAGLWRNAEHVKIPQETNAKRKRKAKTQPQSKQFPINPAGMLPGGETFANYDELREQIARHYNGAFARGLAENLIAYGLGRPYAISDYNLATTITSEATNNGNSMSAFIHAFVQSKAFQTK